MKQPIYIISKKHLDDIFDHAVNHAVIPHSHDLYKHYWGTLSSKKEFIDMINSITFDENNNVLISKVMEIINKRLVAEKGENVNRALISYKQNINNMRTISYAI